MPEWGSTDVKEELVKEKEKSEKKTEESEQNIDPKKDQLTLPQAAASTPKSDVRTLDKPRDLENSYARGKETLLGMADPNHY